MGIYQYRQNFARRGRGAKFYLFIFAPRSRLLACFRSVTLPFYFFNLAPRPREATFYWLNFAFANWRVFAPHPCHFYLLILHFSLGGVAGRKQVLLTKLVFSLRATAVSFLKSRSATPLINVFSLRAPARGAKNEWHKSATTYKRPLFRTFLPREQQAKIRQNDNFWFCAYAFRSAGRQ
jgi:hypothetical protein